MTYEEWIEQKIENEKRFVGYSEKIPYEHEVWDAFIALNKECFNKRFNLLYFSMYWMSQEVKSHVEGDVVGMYNKDHIILRKEYYDQHGLDDYMINVVFHEMLHAYCEHKNIKDTKGEEHLRAFYDASVACGGTEQAELTPSKMRQVRNYIAKM